jgi:hypothetical protein
LALQDAGVPPFVPAQVQVQGQLPSTGDAVPTEHKLLVGLVATVEPFVLPHTPFSNFAQTPL